MPEPRIRQGVSLYSYQDEAFRGKHSLEDLVRLSSEFGATGIEVIPEQSFDNYPDLTDAQIAEWFEMHERYGTTPVAYDLFLDTKRFPGRVQNLEENLESVRRDIVLADKLDTRIIRMIANTPPEVMEHSASFARDHNVRLALEVHAPLTYNSGWVLKHLEVIHRIDNGFLGLLPDMSTFTKRFPRIISDRALRDGADPEMVHYIVEEYNSHRTDPQAIAVEVAWKGGSPVDIGLAHAAAFYGYSDPREMLPHMPYLFHIQAKFYEMVDENHEFSIDYDEIIPVLQAGGYSGYLSSEYEGNRHIEDIQEVDSLEQVRRQHVMFRNLLTTSTDEEEPKNV